MLRDCDDYCVQLTLYLDGELDEYERAAFESHLRQCRSCQQRCARHRRFFRRLKQCAPLYVAPESLRGKVAALLAENERGEQRETVRATPASPPRSVGAGARTWAALAATLLLIMAGLWGSHSIGPAYSSTFAATAADSHLRYMVGRLPLELVSDSPDQISDWFDGKVPFSLKLPSYQEESGQDLLYSLRGARLIGFNGDYAAYVAYQMGNQPISLVVTSSDRTKPEGGEQIASRGLVFHFETIAGLKVITWSHRGLTYALVSEFDERGQQSCMVCHEGSMDEDFSESLDRPVRRAGTR